MKILFCDFSWWTYQKHQTNFGHFFCLIHLLYLSSLAFLNKDNFFLNCWDLSLINKVSNSWKKIKSLIKSWDILHLHLFALHGLKSLIGLLELGSILWFKTHSRNHRTYCKTVEEMSHLCELSVLRLQLFWQLWSFNKRRIFEIKISGKPLFPGFPWINDWIWINFLFFGKKISGIVWINHIN